VGPVAMAWIDFCKNTHVDFGSPGSPALKQFLLQGLIRRCCVHWNATDQDRAFPKSTMGFELNPEGQSSAVLNWHA
jgi:hypothetical protein